jgi:hypothetical protein
MRGATPPLHNHLHGVGLSQVTGTALPFCLPEVVKGSKGLYQIVLYYEWIGGATGATN